MEWKSVCIDSIWQKRAEMVCFWWSIGRSYLLSQTDTKRRPDIAYHGPKDIELDLENFSSEVSVWTQDDLLDLFGCKTFVSTSWDNRVALQFMSGKDLLMKIVLNHKNYSGPVFGADMSWISKFLPES